MRAAILVGNTIEEKRYIVDLINDAYSMRSAFVHGNSSKTSQKLKLSLVDLSKEFLETYRRILNAAMEYQIDHNKTIGPKDIDDMLLT